MKVPCPLFSTIVSVQFETKRTEEGSGGEVAILVIPL